jgi:type I restriction enzyme S subunit
VARIAPSVEVRSEYLVNFLKSSCASQYWQLLRQGSTFSEVSIESVRELALPVPDVDEQDAINAFLRSVGDRYSKLSKEAAETIILLQERRAALISAAVTGKIDVRDLASDDQSSATEAA